MSVQHFRCWRMTFLSATQPFTQYCSSKDPHTEWRRLHSEGGGNAGSNRSSWLGEKQHSEFHGKFQIQSPLLPGFEMLDRSLWDLMKGKRWTPLRLKTFRPVIHQPLVALDAQKCISVLHRDLKRHNTCQSSSSPTWWSWLTFSLVTPADLLEVGEVFQVCQPPIVWSYQYMRRRMCHGISVPRSAPLPWWLCVSVDENYGAAAASARGPLA